jgi:hypothetical protein
MIRIYNTTSGDYKIAVAFVHMFQALRGDICKCHIWGASGIIHHQVVIS